MDMNDLSYYKSSSMDEFGCQFKQMNQAFVDLLCKAKLRHLSLADCKLEPKTIKAIGEGLQTNQFLETLNLKLNTLAAPYFLEFC